MKKLTILSITILLTCFVSLKAVSDVRYTGDIRLQGMGSVGMGVTNDARLLFGNVSDAAHLKKPSFTLCEVSGLADDNGLKMLSAVDPSLKDFMTFKMETVDRLNFMRRVGEYKPQGMSNIYMSVAPFGIVGDGGGLAIAANNRTSISSRQVGDHLEVKMNRILEIKTMIAFVRDHMISGGKVSWGFGIPVHYSIKVNEEGNFDNVKDANGPSCTSIEGNYSTYTDVGWHYGLDAGVSFTFKNTYIGFAAHNIVSSPINWKRFNTNDIGDISAFNQTKNKLEFEELEQEKIKPDFSVGLARALDYHLMGFFNDFYFSAEAHSNKDEKLTYNVGSETKFLGICRLRCGLDEGNNFCYGLGFDFLKIIECNYASYWIPTYDSFDKINHEKVEYENVQGVSVGMKF